MVVVEGTVNIVFKLFLPFLFIGGLFCNEASLTDDEIIQLFHSINELEYKDSLNTQIIKNLEFQIVDYKNLQQNSLMQIEDYKKQLKLKEDMIDLVKPKWYHNRYIW